MPFGQSNVHKSLFIFSWAKFDYLIVLRAIKASNGVDKCFLFTLNAHILYCPGIKCHQQFDDASKTHVDCISIGKTELLFT